MPNPTVEQAAVASTSSSDHASVSTPAARLADVVVAGLLLAAGATGAALLLTGIGAGSLLQSMVAYAVLAVLVLAKFPPDTVGPGLGWANRVTLLRGAMLALLAGVAGHGELSDAVRWAVVVLAFIALALDGVDGAIARRTATASAFGARFDMEVDAALILLLALLVWQSGQTGAWVLALGALRYVFVAAGWWLRAMRRPLPESLRRKAVCVVQVLALPVCLAPVTPVAVAGPVALVALTLLLWSFVIDTHWLLRRSGR